MKRNKALPFVFKHKADFDVFYSSYFNAVDKCIILLWVEIPFTLAPSTI